MVFHLPFCAMAMLEKSPINKQSHQETITPGCQFHMDFGFFTGPKNLQDVINKNAKSKHGTIACRGGYTSRIEIHMAIFPLITKEPPVPLKKAFLRKFGNPTSTRRTITTTKHGLLYHSKEFNTHRTTKKRHPR
mmetsp:Transcript_12597/g.19378  ORF Transcript_12597/g.19378 Transcript_12597/m.19378 type:complete len:134 (-) Transcript_12597:2384-2785(-)